MRLIKYLVLHCTATSPNTRVSSIKRYWKETLKWRNPGYHFIIDAKGQITQLQPLDKPSNGVRGYNSNAIHISYIGGVDASGRAKDTRTTAQKIAMAGLVKALHGSYPRAKVQGHRDFPGVKKDCPSFDVKTFLREIAL